MADQHAGRLQQSEVEVGPVFPWGVQQLPVRVVVVASVEGAGPDVVPL